jgi:hypothetical protein
MSNSFSKNILSGKIQRKVSGNAVKNMTDALFLVSIDAQNRAPIKTGRLRSDVFRNIYKIGGTIIGEFIFLRGYAEVQHEGLDFAHPKGGESEFAKKALENNVDKVMRILSRGILR